MNPTRAVALSFGTMILLGTLLLLLPVMRRPETQGDRKSVV